jgi:hypothetical protein
MFTSLTQRKQSLEQPCSLFFQISHPYLFAKMESNKENIADGLLLDLREEKTPTLSPKRSKKSRSLSVGPGASTALKETAGNRRKVRKLEGGSILTLTISSPLFLQSSQFSVVILL